ncbi:MAG TPA: YjbQ family protein, partial [Gammaproteobacteria bacterium]|nr:YjbQ family protein [Gammaproteobacteria bacterium]
MYQKDFSISTNGQGLTEITNEIDKIVLQSQTEEGLCNVFIKHTSASLLIQENASPDVLTD